MPLFWLFTLNAGNATFEQRTGDTSHGINVCIHGNPDKFNVSITQEIQEKKGVRSIFIFLSKQFMSKIKKIFVVSLSWNLL